VKPKTKQKDNVFRHQQSSAHHTVSSTSSDQTHQEANTETSHRNINTSKKSTDHIHTVIDTRQQMQRDTDSALAVFGVARAELCTPRKDCRSEITNTNEIGVDFSTLQPINAYLNRKLRRETQSGILIQNSRNGTFQSLQ
jgi:hypothetical protein